MIGQNQKGRSRGWIKIVILPAVVAAIILVFRFTPLSISNFTPEKIKTYVLGFGVLAPLVFVVIYFLRAVILVLPVGVMSLAGGLIFGKWWGTLYILMGATIGACISFLIARYFGRSFIESRGWIQKGRMKAFDEGIQKYGFRFVLFVRFIPLFQYDAVNFGMGFTKIKFRDYAIGSFVGMAPGGFINALLGSSLENVISTQFFVALGLFVLLMFIPAIYKIAKRKKTPTRAEPTPHTQKERPPRGRCPGCRKVIGMLAAIAAWDNWGKFVCPGCGKRISFRRWLLAVICIFLGLIGVERLLHFLMVANLPLWLGFSVSLVLALFVMFLVPMIWWFDEGEEI